jgi:hypothetical protein
MDPEYSRAEAGQQVAASRGIDRREASPFEEAAEDEKQKRPGGAVDEEI